MHIAQANAERGKKLSKAGKCPTCGQDAVGVGKQITDVALKDAVVAATVVCRHDTAIVTLSDKETAGRVKLEKYTDRVVELERDIVSVGERIADLQRAADEETTRN